MFRELKAGATRVSGPSGQTRIDASGGNCLLCRVLSPAILQHRHLEFISSEAMTVFIPRRLSPKAISLRPDSPIEAGSSEFDLRLLMREQAKA